MSDNRRLRGGKTGPGKPPPLGATLEPAGVSFALFSQYAREVRLLLFDRADGEAEAVIPLTRGGEGIWHVFVPGLKAGQLYGYKAAGDYDPGAGFRFNDSKLLIDPYARAVTHKARDRDGLLLGYDAAAGRDDELPDRRPNDRLVPKAIVVDGSFDWQGDAPPGHDWESLVIYEVHVSGFSAGGSSGVASPGTYPGFAEKIGYLRSLGVNAVELLPVQEHFSRTRLERQGLKEYWGYNTLCFFAPESSWAAGDAPGCQVAEFKALVRELHKAGLEVILDVVFNHTGEGDRFGPTLSFRGLDNPSYYALGGPREAPYLEYLNEAGSGNILNAESPAVRRLILDALRYWVGEMHVDGFRFDLATLLARREGRFDPAAPLLGELASDPLLAGVKLIAEPWDLAAYGLGRFPPRWGEWNDRFRDGVRRFLRGERGRAGELARRLAGSPDLLAAKRSPALSVNFVTCHDGFTLHDLWAYEGKHNQANGEANRDGSDRNFSWNCGVEGETRDPALLSLRRRLAKNGLCCLLLARGTPMLLGGDEFLRTQGGNNNAYCQDNPVSWFDWRRLSAEAGLVEFTRRLIAFRRSRPLFWGGSLPAVRFFGENLQPPDVERTRLLVCLLAPGEAGTADGAAADGAADGAAADGAQGAAPREALLMVLNARPAACRVALPPPPAGRWWRVADTGREAGEDFLPPGSEEPVSGSDILCGPRSVLLLASREDAGGHGELPKRRIYSV
jgi:isoamylase